ncbi:hypothetical protein J7E88_17835 [Streptomyces sp. ISL-10]|nr:hypothetical protein [Streptomyces sp. ISL-10]MBT2367117.1 hypothetical protein [Streptomyces sp. ISL-10]
MHGEQRQVVQLRETLDDLAGVPAAQTGQQELDPGHVHQRVGAVPAETARPLVARQGPFQCVGVEAVRTAGAPPVQAAEGRPGLGVVAVEGERPVERLDRGLVPFAPLAQRESDLPPPGREIVLERDGRPQRLLRLVVPALSAQGDTEFEVRPPTRRVAEGGRLEQLDAAVPRRVLQGRLDQVLALLFAQCPYLLPQRFLFGAFHDDERRTFAYGTVHARGDAKPAHGGLRDLADGLVQFVGHRAVRNDPAG